jgi:2-polyprenyl-3-methyl-5-hydroxy-6-metoxy-1,4-benzoquinol methylase
MTWEETIRYIRTQPEYKDLVNFAYFEKDLKLNVERFRNSEEFGETCNLIEKFGPDAKTILDVGSGNGISAVSFALKGYDVTATEPDKSNTVGAGAIRRLIEDYQLKNLQVFESFAEDINVGNELYDIVYVRQAMHHAYDLNKFISNLSSCLKKGGIMLTIRDHIIYNEKDKAWFLSCHPLQKYYGGENAYTEQQYKNGFTQAGLKIKLMLKYYDSIINLFPDSKEKKLEELKIYKQNLDCKLKDKLGMAGKLSFVRKWYYKRNGFDPETLLNEKRIPGRMYSFIAQKI